MKNGGFLPLFQAKCDFLCSSGDMVGFLCFPKKMVGFWWVSCVFPNKMQVESLCFSNEMVGFFFWQGVFWGSHCYSNSGFKSWEQIDRWLKNV